MVTASRLLFLLALCALSLAWPKGLRAEAPLVIGVLTDMSGTSRDMSGPGSVTAAEMAVEDFGDRVLGRPIKVISGDHQLRPDIASQIARRWYDIDGVDLIVSVPFAAAGLAVQQVSLEKKKIVIVTGTGTSDFTGKFCTPYSMQWVFNSTALANGTVRALMARGLKTWFFMTADYAFGHSLERDATKLINASGGKVIGSVNHPFNTSELSSFVLQAQASKADVIALANGPPDNTTAIKEFAEFGGEKSGQLIAALFATISDVHGIGLNAAKGLILTESFYWDFDEKTRQWSERFFKRTGKMPTSVQAGDYSATLHYLKAVQAAGTTDALRVAKAMRDMPVDDMFARHGRLRPSGLMVHDLFVAQVKEPAKSTRAWDYYDILQVIAGKDAFASAEEEGCPLNADRR